MASVEPILSTGDLDSHIDAELERLRNTFKAGVTRSITWRTAQIGGLIRFAKEQSEVLIDAM